LSIYNYENDIAKLTGLSSIKCWHGFQVNFFDEKCHWMVVQLFLY
jgi:hypothetical protein